LLSNEDPEQIGTSFGGSKAGCHLVFHGRRLGAFRSAAAPDMLGRTVAFRHRGARDPVESPASAPACWRASTSSREKH